MQIEVEAIAAIALSDLRLFLVITEDGAVYATRSYNQTMRDMIPGATGDPISLAVPGDTVMREYDFFLDSTWVMDSCNAVVFVQDYSTKEIIHSAASRILDLIRRDVGPAMLLSPGDTVACDSSYAIQVRIANFGDGTETFDVTCQIDTLGETVYSDTETVTALAPGGTYDVTFVPGWDVPVAHEMVYDITVATLLGVDDSTGNDTLFGTFLGRCRRDVAPTRVVWPGDTVYCGSSSEPEIAVANLGQIEEGFDLVVSIDTGGFALYTDTAAVLSLGPAETTNVNLASWLVPVAHDVIYDLTVWTELLEDADASNDTLRESSLGWCSGWRDVYPSRVIWPGDTVLCDSAGDIRVMTINAGGLDETFDVVVVIDTNGTMYYSDTAGVFDLTAGDSTEAVFAPWTVPGLDSTTYGIRAWTLLASDSIPANDTLSGSFYAYCIHHDCGVEAILAPPDTVSIDTANIPRASIRNWGMIDEALDVVCTIDGYADTQHVAGLAPGTASEVIFAPWDGSTPGPYLMTVVTVLLSDENPQNDTASKAIWGLTAVSELRAPVRTPYVTRILDHSPNPLTTHARIDYCIAAAGRTSLSVYDMSGRLIKTLFDGRLNAGYYSALWEGADSAGNPVASGVYFYRLKVGTAEATRKTVVLR